MLLSKKPVRKDAPRVTARKSHCNGSSYEHETAVDFPHPPASPVKGRGGEEDLLSLLLLSSSDARSLLDVEEGELGEGNGPGLFINSRVEESRPRRRGEFNERRLRQ